jgi:hypothetical protein
MTGMRFRLRTLMIVLAVAPPLLAFVYWTWGTRYSLFGPLLVLIALWIDYRNAQIKGR